MTELILLLQADLDLQTAFERYEDYQQGRGEDVRCANWTPHLCCAPASGDRASVCRPLPANAYAEFPYGIFYEAQSARIVVAAIMDLRQAPQAMRRRLRQSGD